MRILILGDTHGNESTLLDADDKASKLGCELIIQVGDFGYFPKLWEYPKFRLDTKLYFIDGNHDDHVSLKEDLSHFSDSTNCWHKPRGHVEEIGGLNFMFIGGASSIDKDIRIEGRDWWPEENITREDINKCLDYDGPLDVIIAHEAPSGMEPKSELYKWDTEGAKNRLYLKELRDKHRDVPYFHGHWHMTKQTGNMVCLHMTGVDGVSAVVYDTELKDIVDYARI